jgi:hypothetical protein
MGALKPCNRTIRMRDRYGAKTPSLTNEHVNSQARQAVHFSAFTERVVILNILSLRPFDWTQDKLAEHQLTLVRRR